jgi:hypothetical protein
MSIVLKCDTCINEIELDRESPDTTLPDGWTTDDLERDICNFCNGTSERLESEIPNQEEAKQFVKELKKETRKLKKSQEPKVKF